MIRSIVPAPFQQVPSDINWAQFGTYLILIPIIVYIVHAMPAGFFGSVLHDPLTGFGLLPFPYGFGCIQVRVFDIAHGELMYNQFHLVLLFEQFPHLHLVFDVSFQCAISVAQFPQFIPFGFNFRVGTHHAQASIDICQGFVETDTID